MENTVHISSRRANISCYPDSYHSENSELISRAVEYIKENASSGSLSITDISVHVGFSTDYFNRIFLSHTGFTAMAYVNYIRTQKAAELLRTTKLAILDIALAVGYESHQGFLKSFKKYYGMTPQEYRSIKKGRGIYYGETVDKSVVARFVHENPDFQLTEQSAAIDWLLGKDAKRYGYFCTTIKYMGLEIAAPNGDMNHGFIAIGDDKAGGSFLEAMTDDFTLLADWIKRFSNLETFYSQLEPKEVQRKLADNGVDMERLKLDTSPQAIYFRDEMPYAMWENILIRPLSYQDKDYILKWAGDRNDGYVKRLLSEKSYRGESVLEYGVFSGNALIAIAGCEIDEVRGFRLNNCCVIRFAKGFATDALYRQVFRFVINDLLNKGILPYDDIQHGEYARSHGNFTSSDMGFTVVNWQYTKRQSV